jgi:hypothetical protein
MLAQLSKIRLDKKQIYSVRDITLNRDVFAISLNRGALAFTETIDGKVTGAVFVGSGDILGVPPDAIEKKQLFRYTKSALLNEHFETAVFRFTDNTYEEILKEYRKHAEETVDEDTVTALLRWESEIQRRGAFLNDRLLEDLLASSPRPFFLAQIEAAQLGWFDAIYDERRMEEVLIQQNTRLSNQPLVWASFNKRSQTREPAAFAHEGKLPFRIISASEDGASVKLKLSSDGERVLPISGVEAPITEVGLENGPSLIFVQTTGRVAIVLPEPSHAGAELTLRVAYGADDALGRIRLPNLANAISAAGYRDQWIVEGLSQYATVSSNPQRLMQARAQLLESSSENGTNESAGPVYIGFRMGQPALQNKSIWIMHMLRNLLQSAHGDMALGNFLEDLGRQFQGQSISTFDFKKLAEKHYGKSLDWFFDDWVFGTGIPSYKLDSKIEAGAGGFVLTGNITQSGVPDTFEAPVPLYADETLLGLVNVSVDGGEFRFVSRTRPQQLHVDPRSTILGQ